MDSSARRMAKGVGEVKQVEAKDETKIKHSDHRGTQSHREVRSKAFSPKYAGTLKEAGTFHAAHPLPSL
jgi:hypothetical protein